MESKRTFLTPDKKAWLDALLFKTPFNTSPEGFHESRPAVVVAPGGGYKYCSKREGVPAALHFSLQGYQTFVLEYHCGEESDFPTPLTDLALALGHIRAHAAEYDVDPNRVATLGFSAGGHLCALLGSHWNSLKLRQLTRLESAQVKPNALILGYPVVDLKALRALLTAVAEPADAFGTMLSSYSTEKDPMQLVNALIPPTFLFTTLEDTLIPAEHTLTYAQRLLGAKVPIEFHLFSEGEHGLGSADGLTNHGRNYPKRVGAWINLAVAWLNAVFEHEC